METVNEDNDGITYNESDAAHDNEMDGFIQHVWVSGQRIFSEKVKSTGAVSGMGFGEVRLI